MKLSHVDKLDRALAVRARGRHLCDIAAAIIGSAAIGYMGTQDSISAQQDAANQSYQASLAQDKLSQQQLDLEKQQLGLSQQQFDANQKAYDKFTGMYTPVMQQSINDAQNYDSSKRLQQVSGQAHTDVVNAYNQAEAAQNRQLASMGINPNSGRYAALNAQGNVAMGAADAGAQNSARTGVYNTAAQMRETVAGAGLSALSGANTGMYYGLSSGNGANQTANGSLQNLGNSAYNSAIAAGSLGNAANNYLNYTGNMLGNLYTGVNAMRTAGGGGWGTVGGGGGMEAAPVYDMSGGMEAAPVYGLGFAHGGLVHAGGAAHAPAVHALAAPTHPAALPAVPIGAAPAPTFSSLTRTETPALQTLAHLPMGAGLHFARGGMVPPALPPGQSPAPMPMGLQVDPRAARALQSPLGGVFQALAQKHPELLGHGAAPAHGVLHAESGGPIHGPGTSTSDSIPARLSDGEYVINAHAVRKLGTDYLDRLNSKGLGLPTRGNA